jgi:hypothetical protein
VPLPSPSRFSRWLQAHMHIITNCTRPGPPAGDTAANNNAVVNQAKITGVVTDEKNLPLPGVSVKIKGTTIGITTDAAGRYSIEAGEARCWCFRLLGIRPKK